MGSDTMETREFWLNELRAYFQPSPPIGIMVVIGAIAALSTLFGTIRNNEDWLVWLLADAVAALIMKVIWDSYCRKVKRAELVVKEAGEVTSEDALAADFAASYVVEKDVRIGKQYIYMASGPEIIHASEILSTATEVDNGGESSTTSLVIGWKRKEQKRIDHFNVGGGGFEMLKAEDRYTRSAELIEKWVSDWRKENDLPEPR